MGFSVIPRAPIFWGVDILAFCWRKLRYSIYRAENTLKRKAWSFSMMSVLRPLLLLLSAETSIGIFFFFPGDISLSSSLLSSLADCSAPLSLCCCIYGCCLGLNTSTFMSVGRSRIVVVLILTQEKGFSNFVIGQKKTICYLFTLSGRIFPQAYLENSW